MAQTHMARGYHVAGRTIDINLISGGRDLDMYTHGPKPEPVMSLHVWIIPAWGEGAQTSYGGVREPSHPLTG